MTLHQFLRILRARWILAASVFGFVVALTVILSLVLPKSYKSSATIMADVRPDPVSAMSSSGLLLSGYLATQVDIIKSPTVAQKVVRTLRLTENDDMRARWEAATKGRGDFTVWLAEVIGRGLDVKPSHESNVIEIEYEGSDPSFAAALANAYAQAYIESTVQIRVDPAKQYADFFEERSRLAREKLEKAQARLAAAQKEKGIVATEERLDVESLRLSELSNQVTSLRALKSETGTRSAQALRNPDQLQDVLNSSLIASLKADQARQESRLQELMQRYGDAHPSVVEAKSNLATLNSKIHAETARITGSVNINKSMAGTRESEALEAFEAQRQRVLKLKDSRYELQVLEREVESAQRIYDSIQQRLSQTNLESNANQSGLYLLSKASEPSSASSPKLVLNTIVSIVIGTLLALMSLMVAELLDRRIRGPIEITQVLEMQVIGILPAPKGKKGLLSGSSKRTNDSPLPPPSRNSSAIEPA
jgi:succinoglycan biosynthesis transport protein ExoP